jgi:hypothetical protein
MVGLVAVVFAGFLMFGGSKKEAPIPEEALQSVAEQVPTPSPEVAALPEPASEAQIDLTTTAGGEPLISERAADASPNNAECIGPNKEASPNCKIQECKPEDSEEECRQKKSPQNELF